MKKIIACCLFLLFLLSGSLLYGGLPSLVPYYDMGKWGYADAGGRVLIKPQWDAAGFFNNGKAKVTFINRNGPDVYCIIDTKGNYVIPPSRHWNGELYTTWQGAGYNAQGQNGKYGIIDINNKEVIPCLYDKPDEKHNNETKWSGTFYYDSLRNRYFCRAVKNGRFGIIDTANRTLLPFEYDGLFRIYDRYGYDPPQFYTVVQQDLHGLVDTQNRVVFPAIYDHIMFDRHHPDAVWLWKGNRRLIGNLQGKVLIDIPGYSADFPIGSYIPVNSLQGGYGLMDSSYRLVFPCIYSGVWQLHDTLVLAKDSVVIPGTDRVWYRRYHDSKTLRPLGDWFRENTAGSTKSTAPAPQPEMPPALQRIANGDARQPYGTNITWFAKDGINWVYTCQDPAVNLYGVKGLAPGNDTQLYIAVVDSQQHFIIPPRISDGVINLINSRDSLLEMEWGNRRSFAVQSRRSYPYGRFGKRDSFGVADFAGRMLIPYQLYPIEKSFRYHNQVYAYVITVPEESGGWTPHAVNAFAYYIPPKYGLIDSTGHLAEKLKDYYLAGFCLQSGLPLVPRYRYLDKRIDTFSGYFMAENQSRRMGIISIDGTVQYPKVSFKYSGLDPMGDGFFVVHTDGPIEEERPHYLSEWKKTDGEKAPELYYTRKGQPYLVNANNKVLLDSLSVAHISPVKLPEAEGLYYISPRTNVYPPEGFLLMNKDGHSYYGKLKTVAGKAAGK